MIISFPKSEYVTLCDRIYLIFNPETNNKKYITIERGMEEPSGFLCSWDEKGTHINHNRIASLDWEPGQETLMRNIEYKIVLDLFNKN